MIKQQLPEVELYSDGGANPNPGPGGYGLILAYKGVKKEFNQGYTMTTNNRMELTGVITGLSKLKTKSKVKVYTDSQYTINGIQKGWAEKWKSNNWMRTKTEKAVNYDLWEILLSLVEKHEVEWNWVKGHNGHIENERCDELATLAMESGDLIKDKNYIPDSGEKITKSTSKSKKDTGGEKINEKCKKCGGNLLKKTPKHTKKTLEKQYYYEYYYSCESCKTNFMLEEAKRDISTLKL